MVPGDWEEDIVEVVPAFLEAVTLLLGSLPISQIPEREDADRNGRLRVLRVFNYLANDFGGLVSIATPWLLVALAASRNVACSQQDADRFVGAGLS
jgi:hypothetical protein